MSPTLVDMYYFSYSSSINESVEKDNYSIEKDKIDEQQPASARDARKGSPQQEAIRTYLNSRNINVTQDPDAYGSDSR